jgi:hypothetical protein
VGAPAGPLAAVGKVAAAAVLRERQPQLPGRRQRRLRVRAGGVDEPEHGGPALVVPRRGGAAVAMKNPPGPEGLCTSVRRLAVALPNCTSMTVMRGSTAVPRTATRKGRRGGWW